MHAFGVGGLGEAEDVLAVDVGTEGFDGLFDAALAEECVIRASGGLSKGEGVIGFAEAEEFGEGGEVIGAGGRREVGGIGNPGGASGGVGGGEDFDAFAFDGFESSVEPGAAAAVFVFGDGEGRGGRDGLS